MASSSPCVTWIGEQREEGAVGLRIGRAGEELVADFEGIGVLRAKRSGGSSVFEAAPGAHPLDVAKLRAGILPALLRHLEQKLTLHGASVSIDGVALAFIGESGAGKSTLAARLCTAGAALVADDTTALEWREHDIAVVPTEAVHWLVSGIAAPDATGDEKCAVEPSVRAEAPVRVGAVCRLRFDDAERGPVLRPLRGSHAVQAIVPTVIRFVIDEPGARACELDQLARLITAVPIYELVRPRGAAGIDATVSCVVELARSLARGDLA